MLPITSTLNHELYRSAGTVVSLQDIFHSLPVRRRGVSELVELEKMKRSLSCIALIQTTISLSLHNNQTMKCLLHTTVTGSILKTFSLLYGRDLINHLKPVSHTHLCFSVSGYISTVGHHTKSLQFIYVNKRLVCRTQLHSHINAIISKSLITRRLARQSETKTSMSMSPQSSAIKFGVFIINIECSVSEYDICLEPAKTLIEFKEWDQVLTAVGTTVKQFLTHHHLSLGIDKIQSPLISHHPLLTTEQLSFGLHSHPVKRTIDLSSSYNTNITSKCC